MPTLRLDADARNGVKAFADLEKSIDKADKALDKTTGSAKQLEAAARRITENANPQQRYNREMQRLGELVAKGKVHLSDAQIEAQRLEQRLSGIGKVGEKAFGGAAFSQIGGMITQYFSAAAAVGAISTALLKVESDNQRAADSVMESLGALGELQLISDSPEDYAKNLGRARELARRGIAQGGQAADIAGAFKVAGLSESEASAAMLFGERKQIKPEDMVDFVKKGRKVANLYEGQGLDFAAVADRLGVASEPGDSTVGEFATATTKFGQQNKFLKFSGDEGLAALATIEQSAGGIDIAGTQLGSFYDQLIRRDLAKGTLEETIKGIDSRVQAGESPIEILGETNAAKAYSALSGSIGDYQGMQERLGGSAGFMDSRNFVEDDPRASAALAKEQSLARLESMREEKNAERELLLDAMTADRIATRGEGAIGSTFTNISSWLADVGQNEDDYFRRRLSDNRASGGNQLSPEMVGRLEEYLRRIADGVGSGTTRQE